MIALGSDHGGFKLKEAIKKYLDEENIKYKDFGTFSEASVDYPIYGQKVALEVSSGNFEKGILFCGTGIGISIAANKVKGIRAVVGTSEECVELSRKHNNANILCLGGRTTSEKNAKQFIEIFLNTPFDGGRHSRRIDQITKIENCEVL